ncbi:hypothetical protein Gekk315_00089 [Aeromonas phage Gekk3-15]
MSKQNPQMPAIQMLKSTNALQHFTGVAMGEILKGTVVAHKDKMPLESMNKGIIASALSMCRVKTHAISMVGAENESAVNYIVARERTDAITRVSTSMAYFLLINEERMKDEEFAKEAEIVAEVIQCDVCECCGNLESTLQGIMHDIEGNIDNFLRFAKSGAKCALALELSCDDSAVEVLSELMAEIGEALCDPSVRASVLDSEVSLADVIAKAKGDVAKGQVH